MLAGSVKGYSRLSELEEGFLGDDDNRSAWQAGSEVAETASEEAALLRRRLEQPGWRLDRGAGYFQEERIKNKRAYLVETGKHAGRSRVKVEGILWTTMLKHILKRDFFNAAVNAKLWVILGSFFTLYVGSILFWSVVYYITYMLDGTCFTGFDGLLVSAVLFSIETQQTIGYGVRAAGNCWVVAFLIGTHCILTVLMECIILGIAFARISHPKNRARTVLISDCACIARRDGILKFMFRLADIQKSKVVAPRVNAYLYTWGVGRTTQEGEHLPVQVHELVINFKDPALLLPVVLEHTIDERSPLYGHTQQSLEALSAEVVIVFDGTTGLGDMFMVRQSYLPPQIHWGHTFVPILQLPKDPDYQITVDIARFHDVQPQPRFDMTPPHKLSRKIVEMGDKRTAPPAVLKENTLAISDDAVVASRDGKLYFMFRVGDSYPGGQMLDVHVSAHIYRWQAQMTSEGEVLPFSVEELHLTPSNPTLRFPVLITHEITEGSPIAGWTSAEAKRKDLDAEVVVTVRAFCYPTNQAVVKSKVYPVLGRVKFQHVFAPIVSSGARTAKTAQVDWANFHIAMPQRSPPPSPYNSSLPPPNTSRPLLSSVVFPEPSAFAAAGTSSADASGSGRGRGSFVRTSRAEDVNLGSSDGVGVDFEGQLSRTSSGTMLIRATSPVATALTSSLSQQLKQTAGREPEGSVRSVETSSPVSTHIPSPHTASSHFSKGFGSWRHTRSLFTALEEMQKLKEQAGLEEEQGGARSNKEVDEEE